VDTDMPSAFTNRVQSGDCETQVQWAENAPLPDAPSVRLI
jgi:hypothetical protein